MRIVFFCLLFVLTFPAMAAQWKAKERVDHYAISGETAFQLYEDIGTKGPKIGITRAIAHTTFDLKWRRDYKPDGQACVLRSSFPFLTIIYTLPKPSRKLSGQLRNRWARFYDGIAAHEKVHGRMIVEMVEGLVGDLTGLRMENDRGCKKIRARVLEIVKAAYKGYSAASGVFDREEMSNGGNVHQLVLGLVNG